MNIFLSTEAVAKVQTHLLALGYFKEESLSGAIAEIDQQLQGGLSELIAEGDIKGDLGETQVLYAHGKLPAKRILVVGLGSVSDFNSDRAREAAAAVIKAAGKLKVADCAIHLMGAGVGSTSELEAAKALAEGAGLAAYRFRDYRSEGEHGDSLTEVKVLVSEVTRDLEAGLRLGEAYAAGTNFARDLVNTPGNRLTPTDMANQAIDMAKRLQMDYEVLDRKAMEKLGMGALLAVAQGSEQPPKMIVLKYQGKEQWADPLALVGKGITFDSGGISLKPAANMEDMKMDMGGGAAVLGAMESIGRLRPAVNVIAVVPAAENMPSGKAYKPGDVIGAMDGTTIEVLNTDAEGRLALADAVSYARKLGAARIIDLATLTGAVLIALGKVATAAMTNDADFLGDFFKAAEQTGEKVWELPTFAEYKKLIESDIADLKNTGGRPAGTITAGLFVGAFAKETPWIHLDIAGTAWTDHGTALGPKGASGVMVRSLVQLACNYGNA